MTSRQEAILSFWFADAAAGAETLERRMNVWFGLGAGSQKAFDESCRREFSEDVESALRGELDAWAGTPSGRLTLILLLDQFPRNLYRGTPRAFAGDAKARALVVEGRKNGADRALSLIERLFFYLPLEHAEDLDAQSQSVEGFQRLVREAPPHLRDWAASLVPYAEQHRDIIVRFGRFPHRNAALGRESTPVEREYLAADAPNFGQGG